MAQLAPAPRLVSVEAAVRSGVVSGVVRDDLGQIVAGVAVSAIGTIQAQARTDATGSFNLSLVPGEYVLRATHAGYVSPYRALVRVGASMHLRRNIIITKLPELPERRVLIASVGLTDPGEAPARPAAAAPPEKGSLHAWYLRHLPRTILRDESGQRPRRTDLPYLPSFVDWAVVESARAATSFFADTHFSGQVNVLTATAMSTAQGGLPDRDPRGIAYMAVSAPIGVHGDWRLRGALSTGGLASWVVLGEYEARDVQAHAFKVGMSYAAQRAVDDFGTAQLTTLGAGRAVASVFGHDRWRVQPGLEIDYGLRLDRYDYVVGQDFISPRVGFRLGIAPKTSFRGLVANSVVAPGADEFLPPPTSGPWLPPERTFASLVPGAPFRSERIRRYEAGVEHDLGAIGQPMVIGVRWFHEDSRDQLATMFGVNSSKAVGHYYVASPGSVLLDGWALRAAGNVSPLVKASVEYSISHARWAFGPEAADIARVMPSAVRAERERLHDVTSTLEASIPDTSTILSVAYRVNSAFTRQDAEGLAVMFDGRFAVQLRQALPLRTLGGARIEFMVSVSNLFRDPQNSGSFYDELLTVRTPRRVLGGVQVRF